MATAPSEQEIAAQRAGTSPAEPAQGPGGAAAALAATAAASAAVANAPAPDVPQAGANAITTAAAGILAAFEGFLAGRREDQREHVEQLLADDVPGLPEDERWAIVDAELEAERAYAAAARERLDAALPAALAIPSRAAREEAVRRILARERRIQEQREQAIAVRAEGAATKHMVRQRSPEGAYWKLSDKVKTHTLDCLAFGDKVWPWSVLDVVHPPLCGPWCQCELWTIDRAVRAGLVDRDSFQTADQAAAILHVHEATVDDAVLDDELRVLEAGYDERWGKGTTKGGQFRPKRGGNPGAPTGLRLRRRGSRMPAAPEDLVPSIVAVRRLDAALDTRSLKVADLQAGDQVVVNGELDTVKAVRSPGLVELEGAGLVLIDRDEVQGVPRRTEPESRDLDEAVAAIGFSDATQAARELHARRQVRERYRGMEYADLLKTRDAQNKQLRRIEADAPGAVDKLTMRRRMTEELTTEIELRTRAAKAQRRMQARAESERTGKLSINADERRELLSQRGDVYDDAGLLGPKMPRPGHRPELFIRSDLSGQPIRHYVTLPDGRRAHPDELTEALRRGRIIVAEDLPRPAGERRYLSELLDDEVVAALGRIEVGARYQVRSRPGRLRQVGSRLEGDSTPTLFMFDRALAREGNAPQDRAAADALAAALNAPSGSDDPKPPAPDPKPPPEGVPGPSFDDVAGVARLRKPGAAGELLAGIHYDPNLTRSETRDGELYLPPGFFKQTRSVREKVLFRHLGGKLADRLGTDGLKSLAEQDAHLKSRKAIVDTYYALNSDSRALVTDVRPDAARLVATAALERGLPLHPEAAKLARRPAAIDTPEPEHPAHALARRLPGMNGTEVRDVLYAAGYLFGGGDSKDGVMTSSFRNHEVGAQIAVVQHETGTYLVRAAAAEVPPAVSDDERAALVGKDTRVAIDRMLEQGFASNYSTNGDWMEFVHPDGRGRALRERDGGATYDVSAVSAFTPLPSQVADARRLVLTSDPLRAIQPGDSFDEVARELTYGHGMRWHTLDGGSLPGGGSFATYRSAKDVDNVILLRVGRDGRTIEKAGLASMHERRRGEIITPAEREQEIRERDAALERAKAENERAMAAAREGLEAAVANGDAKALKAALAGKSPNDAVTLLRKHGFDLRGRRRSGRGADRRITYTLRGPGGTTVKIAGPQTFGASSVDKVAIEGNPQGGKRTRLPAGQAPKDLNELLIDTLGRADELGARFGAAVHVTAIVEGGVQRGAAAHHEWNGTIAIRKSSESKRLKAYLARRAKGQALSDEDHLAFYNDLETLQHEINHGVAKAGDEDGGLSFGKRHYQGLGKNVEEALTEETGHLLAADWLRANGMTDVLAAVKRHPADERVKGVYRQYRVQVKAILDDAGLSDEQRRELLLRMKFQMTPEERNAELVRLASADNLQGALHGSGRRDSAMRRADMMRNFEPVVRPDLSDIDATPPAITTASGRALSVGDTVTVDSDSGTVEGVVIELMQHADMVKVRREDGLTLWQRITRVH